MFKTFEGELHWVRAHSPEVGFKSRPSDPDKLVWRAALIPTKESLMDVMDLQSMGVKNKLKKTDDNRYMINFTRPTERVDKKGKVLQRFDPPKILDAEGVEVTEPIGNGSKGSITVEVYQHGAPGGATAHAARLHSIKVTELVKYKP